MLTLKELAEVKQYVLANLPRVLEADPAFVIFVEGIVADKFPRRDEFTRAVEEWTSFRRQANENFERIDKRFDRVDADIAVLKTDVAVLKTDVAKLRSDVGGLKGSDFENKIRRTPSRWLGRDFVGARNLDHNALFRLLDRAVVDGRIDEDMADDLRLADGIVQARFRADSSPAWFAIETSVVADANDVKRAARRARVLARAVAPARTYAQVVGESATAGAQSIAAENDVQLVLANPDERQ